MSGSQFGGPTGLGLGGRRSDDSYGYFTGSSGSSTTPQPSAAGFAATGIGGGPSTGSTLGFATPSGRGLLGHPLVRTAVVVAVVAVLGLAGFKWWHRNDAILPSTLGSLVRIDNADLDKAMQAAESAANAQGQDIAVAAAGYGTPSSPVALLVFRKAGIADQVGKIPATALRTFGAESCLVSKAETDCFRAAGDLWVTVLAPTKYRVSDVASWTELAYRAQ